MSPDDRRTIEELVARYKLEPSLRDVYVEGPCDSAIVRRVLEVADCLAAAVYQIETVDVPTSILAKHKLDDGNKGRVIALCIELQAAGIVTRQVTGIIDRDCDSFINRTYASGLLLFTDYTCMEMYFYDEPSLRRFCHFFLRLDEAYAAAFLATLSNILQDLFFIRAANLSLDLNLSWLEPQDQCKAHKGVLEFSAATFITKYLHKNMMAAEHARFTTKLAELKGKAHADSRHQIHGHDFVRLLAKCVGSIVRNKSFADHEVVERSLVGVVDHRQLVTQPMFQQLIQRVSN